MMYQSATGNYCECPSGTYFKWNEEATMSGWVCSTEPPDNATTGTEEPETSYMWCPSTMVGCNLCEEAHVWMGTHYEPFTLCAWC